MEMKHARTLEKKFILRTYKSSAVKKTRTMESTLNPPKVDLCVLASFSCHVYSETQGRNVRPVAGFRYEEPLKECRLTTLETRRLSGGQIEVFKILKSYENIDSNIFFKIKERKIARGHN